MSFGTLNKPALSSVGADLRVCPGFGVRRGAGADTQVCPYTKHRKIYAPTLTSLQRNVTSMKVVFLVTALAIAAKEAKRSMSGASRALSLPELTVTSNLTDQEVEPSFLLTYAWRLPGGACS